MSYSKLPTTMVTVDTVSPNGVKKDYKFAMKKAALDIIEKKVVIPAQELRRVYEEIKANKSCRIPNKTGSAIQISLKHPIFSNRKLRKC